MRSKRLRIRSEARQEIAEAFGWYLTRSTEAARAFLDEIEESLRLIVSDPRLYPAYCQHPASGSGALPLFRDLPG